MAYGLSGGNNDGRKEVVAIVAATVRSATSARVRLTRRGCCSVTLSVISHAQCSKARRSSRCGSGVSRALVPERVLIETRSDGELIALGDDRTNDEPVRAFRSRA
jgi:hypothetical protein